MKIPKSFQLLGQLWSVHIVDPKDWRMSDAVGFCDYGKQEIHVLKASMQVIQHTFLHECAHAWFNAMGRDDLAKDEAVVDLLAGLIHQTLVSARYA